MFIMENDFLPAFSVGHAAVDSALQGFGVCAHARTCKMHVYTWTRRPLGPSGRRAISGSRGYKGPGVPGPRGAALPAGSLSLSVGWVPCPGEAASGLLMGFGCGSHVSAETAGMVRPGPPPPPVADGRRRDGMGPSPPSWAAAPSRRQVCVHSFLGVKPLHSTCARVHARVLFARKLQQRVPRVPQVSTLRSRAPSAVAGGKARCREPGALWPLPGPRHQVPGVPPKEGTPRGPQGRQRVLDEGPVSEQASRQHLLGLGPPPARAGRVPWAWDFASGPVLALLPARGACHCLTALWVGAVPSPPSEPSSTASQPFQASR